MEKKEMKEWSKNIEYLIHALTKEWERSGSNYRAYECTREDVLNIYEYFGYFMQKKQEELEKAEGTFLADIRSTKESYVLMRVMGKLSRKVGMASSKKNGSFILILDKEEADSIGFLLDD